ncbi:MAG: hypothetical protein HY736_20270 [Verrucomicrobia bacterium]|nr:hypothetical protein [Verrucomicrobiota bacterium]
MKRRHLIFTLLACAALYAATLATRRITPAIAGLGCAHAVFAAWILQWAQAAAGPNPTSVHQAREGSAT